MSADNNVIIINNDNEDDLSFNRFLELQSLVKKESALKELLIKTGNEAKKRINEECIEIYKNKIEVLNTLQKINIKSNNEITKECILIENNYDYLSVLNSYIPNLLKYLWEDPKLVANILINANKEDAKNYLAPLICNNFYENILSSKYIQDPLIYVLYILLDNEINNIKDIKDIKHTDSFLNKSCCSYLLGQLIEKKDVKDFFKIILENILENLGSNRFCFDIEEISKKDNLNSKKTKNKKLDPNNILISNNLDSLESDDTTNNINLFKTKYLINLSIKDLEQKINETENETLKDYYKYLILNANQDEQAYFQNGFLDSVASMENPENILVSYQQDFMKAIEFIDKLFKNLNDNYRIVPYSIKSICRIIYELIMNKFPNANHIEKYLFISIFFFRIILFPILLQPGINALINNYIISNNILFNVKIISNILFKFVSFQLYKNNPNLKGEKYSPFNNYFLKIIPQVFEFYEKLCKVKIPPFINELIKKNISINEYHFNYFNENPNKVLFYRSIFLNIDEFNAIFKNLMNIKHKLLSNNNDNNNDKTNKELEKRNKLILMALDKINSPDNIKILNYLLKPEVYTLVKKQEKKESIFSKKKIIIEEKKQNVNYFHISELLINDKYKKKFSLEQDFLYYHIKEIKEVINKESMDTYNVNKAKNYISSILYNFRELEKSDFDVGTTDNIISILKELKLFIKGSNSLIDGNIPSEWYLSTLIEKLQKLPEEYRKNDYEKLFNELKHELLNKIKDYNFEDMSIFIDKMKYANRNKIYFNKTKEIYTDIELNNRANNIIENEIININLNFNFNNKKKDFSIYEETLKDQQLNILDSLLLSKKDYKEILCKTIEQFTKYFPNFNKRFSKEVNILNIQKEIELPKHLKIFFNLVNGHIKNIIKNEKELIIINDKIYDYVMSKIYNRIYPKAIHPLDDQIFQKVCQLSPENIIKSKTHFDLDLVLPDINKYFNLIPREKSPRKKLIILDNIFKSIYKLLSFSREETKVVGNDQLNILIYCFVKAKPKMIYTDCKFMELYFEDKKNKGKEFELSQMMNICDYIKDNNLKSLCNVDEEELNQKQG